MTFDLTHARHDPAHCLAPGLFRSLKRGERKKLKLDVTYEYGAQRLRFVGFEPLDAQDMRMLQGIVALSGPKGIILTDEPSTDRGKQLRLMLNPRLDAAHADALVVKGTLGGLMREIGYVTDGAEARRDLKDSLRRMAGLTVFVSEGRQEASFHLLSYAFDEEDNSLFIALNPRVTEAVLGQRGFTRIEMGEVRALQSDPARLIHQRLCGRIAPSKSCQVELDTLCGYVWPDEATAEAMKKRRQTARKAVAELATLSWSIEEYAKGKFEIRRPATSRALNGGRVRIFV